MGSTPDASGGVLAAAAEWLVREAIAARTAAHATTISTSVRLLNASFDPPYRLAGRRIYVGRTSEQWTVDVETSSGDVLARVEVALSLRTAQGAQRT
jgi:acyl-coenzyme A thioesterase PaaI-like protein